MEKYFQEERGITDITLIVEDKEIHTVKAILMSASPVFKAMFTLDFKEKTAQKIPLPEKKYKDFVLFLLRIFPKEYIELNEEKIKRILPLAREYETTQILKDCEAWMISRLSVKKSTEDAFQNSRNFRDISYLLEWLTIAHDYDFEKLFENLLDVISDYNWQTLKKCYTYEHISPEIKTEILEKRLSIVEMSVRNAPKCSCEYKNPGSSALSKLKEELWL
ncbi:BTB and MATH domain-containing protein 38-like [Saccostrea echinata]|uniref:BTB and MATH domain-containing protein 38-like n=1 Tax=Saccostrea echinata TaxID=191078 RepID=UPI002A83244E|nr:BTB and MATH domain-containing protein 38-like [Saccostrea echinata]